MMILDYINIFFITAYLSIMAWFILGWLKNSRTQKADVLSKLSVIIPFRNEEENFANLIQSFNQLNYNLNLVEFIFVDDHSTDKSYAVLRHELNKTKLFYKIIKQKTGKEGKKQALITGIDISKNETIITTDADCTHSKSWLMEYNNAFCDNAQFIIAPVVNNKQNSFLGMLQNIESSMLSGVTIGSAKNKFPFLCSGANMGYKKSLFQQLKPYRSNLAIPSGDDLFFLDAIIKEKLTPTVLDTHKALVFTKPPQNYNDLIQQALRWSSKNGKLQAKRNFWLSILIFAINLLIIPNLIWIESSTSYFFLLTKFSIDFLFFSLITLKFGQKKLLFLTPFIYFLYPIHLLIIFTKSFFTNVKWKGRKLQTND